MRLSYKGTIRGATGVVIAYHSKKEKRFPPRGGEVLQKKEGRFPPRGEGVRQKKVEKGVARNLLLPNATRNNLK